MNTSLFSPADLAQFTELGLTLGHVEELLLTYSKPPPKVRLVRPCTERDGIVSLADGSAGGLLEAWTGALSARRLSKFVPASGAATRMFAAARWLRGHPELWVEEALTDAAEADLEARRAWELLDLLPRMPFWEQLRAKAVGSTSLSSIPAVLEALLESPGYARMPKALLPFHRYDDGLRTALEEHLFEAVGYLCNDSVRTCHVHLTVAPEERERFDAFLAERLPAIEADTGASVRVDLSTQSHATDVLAVYPDGTPARTRGGRLLFRPSGHGALLRNLAACGGDLVAVKNVDNVARAPHGRIAHWKKLLFGLTARIQSDVHGHEVRLSSTRSPESPAVREAVDFLEETFGLRPPLALRAVGAHGLFEWVRERLHRPLRVCGMVRNEGEPGGGPFWVTDSRGGVTPQIVERSQIDVEDPQQLEIWESSTHFNPVDLVCALRDSHGNTYDLERFADPDTAFLVEKTHAGRKIVSLERPGLWNGSMAGWNTIFVEVPNETFAPVKTIRDLLRPAHRS